MEAIHRSSLHHRPISLVEKCLRPATLGPVSSLTRMPIFKPDFISPHPILTTLKSFSSRSIAKAGWLLGLGEKKNTSLPEIVKTGDLVLHEPARVVDPKEISLGRIQRIVDGMVKVMRMAPRVGLAAPQIGIPFKVHLRRVILNPKLKKASNRTALFFEVFLSVDGFRAVVVRYLDVEVTGLSRDGQPIKVDASGWQARMLQHECDHLDATLYVDKMVPKTFRTVKNLDLPLAEGCPKLGAC